MKRGHMIRLSGFSTLDIHLPDESIAKRNYVNPFPTNQGHSRLLLLLRSVHK